MSDRIGIIKVSYGLLEQVLHLPEGHRIRGLRLVDSFSDSFEVAIEGPSLPLVSEGHPIPHVTYLVTVTEDAELVRKQSFVGKFEEARG